MNWNIQKTHKVAIAVMALQIFALPASAQVPPTKNYENINYITGGVGIDEIEAMHSVVKDYNLILQFQAKKNGAFLSDVDITVQGKKGETVFTARSDGPCLFAKVPPGQYKVTASFDGKPLKKSANIKGHHRSELYFYWPVADNNDAADRKGETVNKPSSHPDCT